MSNNQPNPNRRWPLIGGWVVLMVVAAACALANSSTASRRQADLQATATTLANRSDELRATATALAVLEDRIVTRLNDELWPTEYALINQQADLQATATTLAEREDVLRNQEAMIAALPIPSENADDQGGDEPPPTPTTEHISFPLRLIQLTAPVSETDNISSTYHLDVAIENIGDNTHRSQLPIHAKVLTQQGEYQAEIILGANETLPLTVPPSFRLRGYIDTGGVENNLSLVFTIPKDQSPVSISSDFFDLVTIEQTAALPDFPFALPPTLLFSELGKPVALDSKVQVTISALRSKDLLAIEVIQQNITQEQTSTSMYSCLLIDRNGHERKWMEPDQWTDTHVLSAGETYTQTLLMSTSQLQSQSEPGASALDELLETVTLFCEARNKQGDIVTTRAMFSLDNISPITGDPSSFPCDTPLNTTPVIEAIGSKPLRVNRWTYSLQGVHEDMAAISEGKLTDSPGKDHQWVTVNIFVANYTLATQPLPECLFILMDEQNIRHIRELEMSSKLSGIRREWNVQYPIPPDGDFYSLLVVFKVPKNVQRLVLLSPSSPNRGWCVLGSCN